MGWKPRDRSVSPLPQPQQWVSGDQRAAGEWPEDQGPWPEEGDMSEFSGRKWEAFRKEHRELSEALVKCAEALANKKTWENQSDNVWKSLRQQALQIPKEVLQDVPGRRQVILFLCRFAERRPIYKRQVAGVQEHFSI